MREIDKDQLKKLLELSEVPSSPTKFPWSDKKIPLQKVDKKLLKRRSNLQSFLNDIKAAGVTDIQLSPDYDDRPIVYGYASSKEIKRKLKFIFSEYEPDVHGWENGWFHCLGIEDSDQKWSRIKPWRTSEL